MEDNNMKQKILLMITAAAVLLTACSFDTTLLTATATQGIENQNKEAETAPPERQVEEKTPDYHQNVSFKKAFAEDGGLCASKDEKVFFYATKNTTEYVDMISALYNDGYEIVDITIMDTANNMNGYSTFDEIYTITYRIPDA